MGLRPRGAWAALALVLALLETAAATEPPARGLEPLLAQVERHTNVSSGAGLLEALIGSSSSQSSECLLLTADVYIRPADVRAFQPFLPINGGNRTLVLLGARRPSGGQTVLDFGGAVNLMYHPGGHTFVAYNLAIQGMAPASAGIAAGMGTQMVAGAVWPTMTGEPGHLMAFWNTTIRLVTPTCGLNSTNFTVAALQQATRSAGTARLVDDRMYFVGAALNGSYTLKDLTTGDSLGNVRWSWDNTTVTCAKSAGEGAPPSPSTPGEVAALLANPIASTAVVGNAAEFMSALNSTATTRIILGGHIPLGSDAWRAYSLPMVFSSRKVIIESNDGGQKVLDLGEQPNLLYLTANSSLSFNRVSLQGAAPPSSAITSRATIVVGSPLWPTIDGEAGHQLLFINCTVREYVTPCSRNSTQITKDLLREVLGQDGVVDIGDTGYLIVPRFQQTEPIRGVVSQEQVGTAPYTFEQTLRQCQEDPSMELAAELQQQAQEQAAGGGGGMSKGMQVAIAVAAGGGAALLAAVGIVVWTHRRRQGAAAAAAAAAPGSAFGGSSSGKGSAEAASPAQAVSPRASRMNRMESGEILAEIDDKLCLPRPGSNGGASKPASVSDSQEGSSERSSERSSSEEEGQLLSKSSIPSRDVLWRSRFGVIEGLEVGELLGRGAYGKVFKGRWNGVVVAVKVIEHRVTAGDPCSLSREPLLCMSVSHPNCITTYKLSVIRLLRGQDLALARAASGQPPPQEQQPSLPSVLSEATDLASPTGTLGPLRSSTDSEGRPAGSLVGGSAGATPNRLSTDTDDTAMAAGGRASTADGKQGGRRGGRLAPRLIRSLVSGAEAVEVDDPYGVLQPAFYETWIVSEFCECGTLGDALVSGRLRLPDGRPHMVAIYLCLLDIASGMQYLHSLGIMHSDLKPANVLLKGARNVVRGFTCKLADFGLSRMLDGRTTHVETGSYGTPTHAAPELLREGRLSPAVDVYAFGVLAWELVAGEEAFRGWHPMTIILQVTQHGTRPQLPEDCPPELAALMQRCWQEDANSRPTFAELLPELQRQLASIRQAGSTPLPSRMPSVAASLAASGTASLEPGGALGPASPEPAGRPEAGSLTPSSPQPAVGGEASSVPPARPEPAARAEADSLTPFASPEAAALEQTSLEPGSPEPASGEEAAATERRSSAEPPPGGRAEGAQQ